MNVTFYSNGKLLLTAEYGVLDGALALAIPTKYGQFLEIEPKNIPSIEWESLDEKGETWFKANFNPSSFRTESTSDTAISKTLEKLLIRSRELNPQFNYRQHGLKVTTKLTFPRNWGLGSSSTLINNIAQWAKVNPYELLKHSFGGSGYDIACAQNNGPIHYQLVNGEPIVETVKFDPPFSSQLFFVFLNKKQDSRIAIANYRKQNSNRKVLVNELTKLTKKISTESNLMNFETHVTEHEELLSNALHLEPVKSQLFSDYSGAIKSLGGWGGDFILATGNEKTPDYFKAKGFTIVIPFRDMIFS